MARLGLEKEQKISVLLSLLVVGEEAFLGIDRLVEVAGDFVLLEGVKSGSVKAWTSIGVLTSSSAIRF
jgi:hypothetical protein